MFRFIKHLFHQKAESSESAPDPFNVFRVHKSLGLDYAIVKRNLLLTQAYCAKQLSQSSVSNAAIFRSINLTWNGRSLFNFRRSEWGASLNLNYEEARWTTDPYGDGNGSMFDDLFVLQMKRKQELLAAETVETDTRFSGKILAFEVDGTLIDGAAEVESEGILDGYNCPPIDTWFCLTSRNSKKYCNRLLLAWIPDAFVRQVGDGIDVNPEACIEWFKNWYSVEHQLLTNGDGEAPFIPVNS